MSKTRFLSSPHSSIGAVVPAQCSPQDMQTIHMLLSALLEYPSERLTQAITAYHEVQAGLPTEVRCHIDAFLEWAEAHDQRQIAEHYVDTFDHQRRCALYLTYYMAGDTRLRGSAILGFRDFLHALGYELAKEELDDYLPVLLELSGRSGDPLVWQLLASHREGIEVMRAALDRARSPYLHLVNALAATLPEVSAETEERFHRLVSQGPPTEMVGVHLPLSWSTP